jgi:Mn2+/Fe2+ NRAMP family transporter
VPPVKFTIDRTKIGALVNPARMTALARTICLVIIALDPKLLHGFL